MHAVPHPHSHVHGYAQCRVGCLLVALLYHQCDVDESGQLLVDGVVGGPHPLLVVVGAVALYQCRVCSRDGIHVAVAIVPVVLLVFIEGSPGALHLFQNGLWSIVACLEITSQRVTPHEGAFLTLPHLAYHACYPLVQFLLHVDGLSVVESHLVLFACSGVGMCQCREVVARTMPLQFCGRCVPSAALRVALRGESVGITVVVELLRDVKREQHAHIQVTVAGQSVFPREAHLAQWQRFGLDTGRYGCGILHNHYLCINGVSLRCIVVTQDESPDGILCACRCSLGIGLPTFLCHIAVAPPYLSPFLCPVTVGHPHLPGQTRSMSRARLYADSLHSFDGSYLGFGTESKGKYQPQQQGGSSPQGMNIISYEHDNFN